jgi:8-oxo-dGTP pyrophosphatase MutT (NUDIX family)
MNSALYGNTYPIPKQLLNKLTKTIYNNPMGGDGIKRAKNLVKSGSVTYQQLKRLKNFFDTFDSEETPQSEYDFAGGEDMRFFVETTLERERSKSGRSEELKRPIMSAAGNRALEAMKAQDGSVNLKESEEKEEPSKDLKKNALAIIFNDDMEVLLLKRSSFEDQWMPNKWALVGGSVEDGEEPVEAVEREIKEETDLDINDFKEKFVLQRNEDSVEHMYVTKYSGNNDDVKLNEEHQDYKWCNVNEIEQMDIVPNLLDYVRIAVTKYE